MHTVLSEQIEPSATLEDCDRTFDCLAALCYHVDQLGMERLTAALETALDVCLDERARTMPSKGMFISRRAQAVSRAVPVPTNLPRLTLRRDQRLS